MSPRLASALCYFPLLAILFLLLPPYSKDRGVRFHAWQCIGLVVLLTAAQIALILVCSALESLVPPLAEPMEVVTGLITILGLLLFLVAGVMAYRQKGLNLPLVGGFAQKLA